MAIAAPSTPVPEGARVTICEVGPGGRGSRSRRRYPTERKIEIINKRLFRHSGLRQHARWTSSVTARAGSNWPMARAVSGASTGPRGR